MKSRKGVRQVTVEELIDRYGDDILRICLLYLGDRQLAEDAFQETFIKAWRNAGTFRGESSVRTWLVQIAVNTCKSTLRSGWFRMRKKAGNVEELLNLPAKEQPMDLDLTQAVCLLPGKYREVVTLCYYEGMKLREIAQLLNLPVNTVSTRLRKARRLLHAELKGDDDA